MEPGTHFAFIVAAYAAAGAVVGGLIAWVLLDYRAQLRLLSDLERSGVTRSQTTAHAEALRQAKERA
jgi:heme exporter protein D